MTGLTEAKTKVWYRIVRGGGQKVMQRDERRWKGERAKGKKDKSCGVTEKDGARWDIQG